jgi:glutamine amidotransferase
VRLRVLCTFAEVIRPLGPANFVYSDSEYLYLHGHRRSQADGAEIRPPGLYTLCRTCPSRLRPEPIEGLTIRSERGRQEVLLAASVPLTDERWTPLSDNEVLAVRGGRVLARAALETAPA